MLPSRALSITCRLSLLCRREQGGGWNCWPWDAWIHKSSLDVGVRGCPPARPPGVMRFSFGKEGRKEAQTSSLAPWGPALLWCPGVTKSRPSHWVCAGTTQSPARHPTARLPLPFLPPLPSFLASYPEAVSVISLPLLGTRELGLAPGHCGRIPEPGLHPREVVAVPGTKGVSSWISQPAMELRCYLSQDTRSACDCLNPITVLKIGIRDKYCELQRKEPAV